MRKQRLIELQAEQRRHLGRHGDCWTPQYARLVGVPPLIPSEAFSSWCFRTASHLRISISALLSSFGADVTAHEIDMGRISLDLTKISRLTMLPAESLESLLWASSSMLSKPEFTCLMASMPKRRPIYRYCETCLRSDQEPFIRRLWRLAFAYICPIHGSILRDHCAHCLAPLDLRVTYRNRRLSIRRCGRCGGDLCQATHAFLPEDLQYKVMARQSELAFSVSSDTGPPAESYWYPALPSNEVKQNERCQIGSSELNALALFRQILSRYFESRSSTSENEGVREIGGCLVYANSTNASVKPPSMALGFSGPKMFGADALAIAVHLRSCQNSRQGTHWGPIRNRALVGIPSNFDDFQWW